jgi:hypothetical protein
MKSARHVLLALLVLGAPTALRAQSGDNFGYTVNPGETNTVTITSYTGPGGAVTVPSNINDLAVTALAMVWILSSPSRAM